MEYKVHSRENPYFAVKVVCTLLVLAGLAALVSLLSDGGGVSGLTTLVTFGIYVVLLWLFVMFQKIYLVGYMKGNGIAVTERQFPEVHAAYAEMGRELGIKKLPALFILQQGGALNAFAIRFSGRNYVAIYSDVFSLMATDMDAVKFVLGHELGHVGRAHMSKRFWTFPSSLVPFLTQAYSRSCEYTCDNIGMALSPAKPLNGLLVLAAGKELYAQIDPRAYAADAAEQESAAVKFAGLLMSHPYLPKRLRNLGLE